MGKTYDQAPPEVLDRAIALIRKYYPDLGDVQVRLDLLMASTDAEDGHAVTHGGYPADAVIKILGPKERACGRGDVEIVIDRDHYEAMSGAERDALLDHELYHLVLQRTKAGNPKRDDHGRPVFKMRKHDFQVGWFHEIARRHGPAAGEVQQATAFIREHGQLYFGFDDEVRQAVVSAILPTEDSEARDAEPPRSIAERMVDRAAEGHGIEGFAQMAKRDGVSIEIRAGDKSVKIDGSGVHAQPTDEQLDEAVKIAHAEGHVTRSMLQRRLRVGYNHACAIIERLVAAKIVFQEDESGQFQVVAKDNAAADASVTPLPGATDGVAPPVSEGQDTPAVAPAAAAA